jgi:hypothetical protein
MTTKMRRGRDPEQHVVVAEGPQADNYLGLHGELVFVRDEEYNIYKGIQLHDGTTKGGSISIMVPTDGDGPLRIAGVPPAGNISAEEPGSFTFIHGLGYPPLVQIVNADGLEVTNDLTISHSEELDSITVEVGEDQEGDYLVLMR